MPKGPAVVVVARHGARLDAADKSWHLTSPAPYDPPLTYGGWSQAKALGLRIAALLHQRDDELAHASAKNATSNDPASLDLDKLSISTDANAQGNALPRPRKKRKIIIHSSPFLRCVQTSTAVAAGISQYHPPGTPQLGTPTPSHSHHRHASPGRSPGRSPARVSRHNSTSSRRRIFEPLVDPSTGHLRKRDTGPDKILLRIDAFLGEWLSPEYYSDITAPPNSTMMVAGAKADLLRRGDYIQEQPNADSSKGHFPGGWTGGKAATNNNAQSTDKEDPSSTGPSRERSSSIHAGRSLHRTRPKETAAPSVTSTSLVRPKIARVYEAPKPSYSVSPADPIPRGYVAHAQEKCVKVDFQWDSMRPPQDWGDGGEYGDEWSTMHKRFRRGLAGMMEWYSIHGTTPPKESFPGFMFKEPLRLTPPPMSHTKSDPFPRFNDDPGGEDEELVLVLITHGAGCNALLGAMTNQPVLMDIGLASLSMAVRRDEPRKPSTPDLVERRPSVADPGMAETYDIKMSASVDHLRPGVDPSRLPCAQTQTHSPAIAPSPSLEYRRRFTGSSTSSSPLEAPFSIGEPHRSWNSSLGSMRRTMSNGSNSRVVQRQGSSGGTASPSSGLWSASKSSATDAGSDGRASPGPDVLLNLGGQHAQSKPATWTTTTMTTTTMTPPTTNAAQSVPPLHGTFESNNGLTKLDSKEEKEVSDRSTPLVSATTRKQSTSTGGLWGAKVEKKSSHGLWGPPKLDDVYEHSHGPKRRWTVTEREETL